MGTCRYPGLSDRQLHQRGRNGEKWSLEITRNERVEPNCGLNPECKRGGAVWENPRFLVWAAGRSVVHSDGGADPPVAPDAPTISH